MQVWLRRMGPEDATPLSPYLKNKMLSNDPEQCGHVWRQDPDTRAVACVYCLTPYKEKRHGRT